MKKVGHILFVAVVMLACVVPAAGMLILGPSEAAGNEVLNPPPQLIMPDGSPNQDFLSDAADYFSDHFAFRQELVTAESVMKSSLFATSAQTDVALGKNGWLYYAETLDDYTGADVLTPRQAYCAAHSLALVQDYVQARGGTFAFTIAPNKVSIYPEYLAGDLGAAMVEYAAPLVETLVQQNVAYIDLFSALTEQKEILDSLNHLDEPLYFTLDSHWTNKGAALGHDRLMEGLGLSGNAYEKAGEYRLTHRGDLHEMLYPASDRLDWEFEFQEPLAFEYATPIRSVDDLRIQTTSNSPNPPLLMFRDSFGNALHALMAESFSQATFSRAVPYNLTMAEQIGAQYVVLEIVERNLPRLAQGEFLMPAPQTNFTENAERLDAAIALESEPAGNLSEYMRVTGQADVACDPDSPVYVWAGGTAYEAFPASDGGEEVRFNLYLPEGAEVESVLFRRGGQWVITETA